MGIGNLVAFLVQKFVSGGWKMLVFEITFLIVVALMLVMDIIFFFSILFLLTWKSEAWIRKEREYRKKQKEIEK